MKKYNLILLAVGIFAACGYTFAQQKGNGPERFFDVNAYKAEIKITFTYDYTQTQAENRNTVTASQSFEHAFVTGPGQVTAADMFQVERGDASEVGLGANSGMMGGMDMEAISEAMKNSGMDPSVMEELKEAKKETASYSMDFGKYKMWMVDPVSGSAFTRVNTKFYEETTGVEGPCGEGLSGKPYKNFRQYGLEAQSEKGKPGVNNPNSLLLLVNLNNNSYSFSTSTDMLRSLTFEGTEHDEDCGKITDRKLSMAARSFISIRAKKEGLIYKNPLPQKGTTLSGSRDITDSFDLWPSLAKESAKWSVKIDWKIYPAGG
ncbi:hypothetical protein ACT6NV_06420 [Robiginitalea sp. IMCC44478]|uniref:hypothetical protein n=1 Tax=Robiginitalea sp. IMCC44478 TaxID=3459122 RepID=UPI00404360F0